ncbi:GntR family transcriptional regulator [Actinomadura graeca]|uniref:GntR family transcriptional regulator n=1 Tax=Actinomadura graeca TaxID=2750812 RepID=A0ABX8QTS8_9ACTN|nr:GntR family transcriptional regulator [Actinomadura graeca]QXJ20847.1 GntR family transcriptional regulator [Actinomadura graeca]
MQKEECVQVDTVYKRLRELIVAGEYPPGERLTEAALSETLAVSRTPVREALRRLEGDGLVLGAGRGVVVNRLTPEYLDHAYEVRAALESLTAQLAAGRQRAGRIAPASLTGLERDALLLEEVTASGDLARAVALNRQFHRTVAELAGNPIALDALERLWDQIIVSTRESLVRPERGPVVSAEHRDLVRAILHGDEAQAGRIAGDHVRATRATLT